MHAVAHTAEVTALPLNQIAAAAATLAGDHLGTAAELVTERAPFRTVEELTAHCTIGYYTSDRLYRAVENVRPAPADIRADVRQLAALIAHQGLLQNLIGYIDAEGKIAIVAGERRRNAIAFNVEDGILPEDFLVQVLIITKEEAVAVSLAENSGRKDMHHADLSEAVMNLKKAGASVADIAVCFGLDEMVVRRRLRLADLSPVIFDHYRKDEMSFEQVVAYTLVEDHAQQEAAFSVLGPKASPHRIREMLTSQKVNIETNSIVKFVTVEAFEKAGGVVERDLFSTTGGGYIADVALLEKLAHDAMLPKADELRAQGFAWVETKLSLTYSELEQYVEARTGTREPTEAEAAQLQAIEAKQKEIEEKIAALEEAGDYDSEEHADLSAQLDDMFEEHDQVAATLSGIIPEDKPLAGALVFIQHGKIEARTGLIKPEDKKKMAKVSRPGVVGATGADGAEKVRAVHSEALMHNLTTHRTLALRAELMDRPDVAIVLVTHKLMVKAFSTELRCWSRDSMSSLSWDAAMLDKEAEAGKAAEALAARHKEIWESLPQGVNAKTLLPWLLEQDQATVWKMFAYCSALSFDATARKETEKNDYYAPVAKVLSLDMANWWEAGEDYFKRVNLARIAEVVKTVSTEVAGKIGSMKKKDAVVEAVKAIKDSRWVPDFFRA